MKFEKGDKVKSFNATVTVTGSGIDADTFSGVVISSEIYNLGDYKETWHKDCFEKVENTQNVSMSMKFKQGDYVKGKYGTIVLVSECAYNSFSGILIKNGTGEDRIGEYRLDWILGHFEKIEPFDPDSLRKHLDETEKRTESNIERLNKEITQLVFGDPYSVNTERLTTFKTQKAENVVIKDFVSCLRKQFNL